MVLCAPNHGATQFQTIITPAAPITMAISHTIIFLFIDAEQLFMLSLSVTHRILPAILFAAVIQHSAYG